MIRYLDFINEALNKSIKPTREDLSVGKMIKTVGNWDGVNIDSQLGYVISIREYGQVLIEFLDSFSYRLHAGHENIGKPKHCFYVNINNISEIIDDELADKIKNKFVIPFKATPELMKLFQRMNFNPSVDYVDSSFFDLDKDNMNVLTCLPAKKFNGDPDAKKGRQDIKIGKAIKKLRPELSAHRVEEYVVLYRTAFKVLVQGQGKELEIVTGEDIRYWYSSDHYAKVSYGGELYQSCMADPSHGKSMNLWCENPDKIALCIYTDQDVGLLARALLWKLDDGRVYMDRVYAVSDEIKQIVLAYAKKNDMLTYVRDLKGHGGGNTERMEVTLSKDYGIDDRPSGGNPYMDSFWAAAVDKDGRCYLVNRKPQGKNLKHWTELDNVGG